MSYSPIIIMNIHQGFLAILRHMSDTEALMSELKMQVTTMIEFLPANIEASLMEAYSREEFPALLEEHKVDVQDCWYVFVDTMRRTPGRFRENWVPTVDECVRARARTTGFSKTELTIDGHDFVIYDVGGQRSERRKWLKMFEDIPACIFVCAISEYDSTLFEDHSKNCLEESLELWEECINSMWLEHATILLFLNKYDLFKKKFLEDKIPLNASGLFPDAANVANNNAEEALAWFKAKFLSKLPAHSQQRVNVFVLTATDSDDVRSVFNECRGLIANSGTATMLPLL